MRLHRRNRPRCLPELHVTLYSMGRSGAIVTTKCCQNDAKNGAQSKLTNFAESCHIRPPAPQRESSSMEKAQRGRTGATLQAFKPPGCQQRRPQMNAFVIGVAIVVVPVLLAIIAYQEFELWLSRRDVSILRQVQVVAPVQAPQGNGCAGVVVAAALVVIGFVLVAMIGA
jgi:hypothetical protein